MDQCYFQWALYFWLEIYADPTLPNHSPDLYLNACRAAPHAVGLICGRLETVLGLAADLAVRVQLQGPVLIPLIRAAGAVLTISSLPVLQVKAASACPPFQPRDML